MAERKSENQVLRRITGVARNVTYITEQGETWDNIALKVYGSEKYAYFLMQNNYPSLDILVFSSGTILRTPPLPEKLNGSFPPWRTRTINSSKDPYDR